MPSLVPVLLGIATVLFAWAGVYQFACAFAARLEVERSIARWTVGREGEPLRRRSWLRALGDWFDRSRLGKRLAIALARADLALRPSEYAGILLVLAVFLAYLSWLAFQLDAVLNLVIGLGGAALGSRFFLEIRQDHYRGALSAQMPEVAMLISDSLKAGLSIPQAFQMVAQKMPYPAGFEFGRLAREIRFGAPVEEAMGQMLERLQLEELEILLTTIAVQRETGGNLVRSLAIMSAAIAARHRLRDEIRTLTAEERFSSIVIVALPVVTLALVNQMMPGSVAAFFGNPVGWVIGIVYVFSQILALVIVARVASVKV